MIRNPRFHRRRHAQRRVYPAEIVIREVQSASGGSVLKLRWSPAAVLRDVRVR
jgi:hypothetical protein